MKKLLVITGGTSDTGKALCSLAVKTGWTVALCYHNHQLIAERFGAKLNSRTQNVYPFHLDVTNHKEIKKFISLINALKIPLKGIVNIASFADPLSGYQSKIENLSLDILRRSFEVDVLGTLKMIQAVLPSLRKNTGSIVNFSSASALGNDVDLLQYLGPRLSIAGYTRALARQLGPKVRINAIAPGALCTQWLNDWNLKKSEKKCLRNFTALKRLGTPSEVARLALFLISDDSAYVTGQTWIVDGGMFCP